MIDGFMIQGGGFDARMKRNWRARRSRTKRRMACTTRSALSPWHALATRTPRLRSFHQPGGQHVPRLPLLRRLGLCRIRQGHPGLDVVRKIGKVRTTTVGYYQDVPAEPVIIKSVRVVDSAKAGN